MSENESENGAIHEEAHVHATDEQAGGTERIEADWAFVVMSKGERLFAFATLDNALLTHPQTGADIILTSKSEPDGVKMRRACIEVADDLLTGNIANTVAQVQMQLARQAAQMAQGKTESGLVVPGAA